LKTKKKTYLLLVVVISVWGAIGYKIWIGLNPSLPEVIQQDVTIAFNPKTNSVIDTFSVQSFARDPFLGVLSQKNKTKGKKTIKKEMVWIPIQYHGMIAKQNKRNKVFIVTIEGQQYVMKVGQLINGVKLLNGNNTTIYVSYKDVKKKIIKI
jgi:hypothetical protein